MTSAGLRVYGLAAVALGAIDLVFSDFAQPWQAVPDMLPGRYIILIAVGLLLMLGGIGLWTRRFAAHGALVIAALFLLFTSGWVIRVAMMPAVLGTWLGVCETLAVVIGGLGCFALVRGDAAPANLALGVRVAFGICCLVFGAAHFVYPNETGAMVPAWLPPNPTFWAYATGAFHALAGLALVSGIRALLAARLLTAMFVGFGLLVWLPILLAKPNELMSWGGNAINLILTASAWVVADTIARFGVRREPVASAAGDVPLTA